MRIARQALAKFLPCIDWQRFRRQNWNEEIEVSDPAFAVFGCGDEAQAVIWLLRTDQIGKDGRLQPVAEARPLRLRLPILPAGCYRVTAWDTRLGVQIQTFEIHHPSQAPLALATPPFTADLALAVKQVEP
jgi:mannan endo-1,4-beta-mannosidase